LSPAAVRPADQAGEALTFHEILGTGIALSHADDSLNLLVLEILVHFQLVLHLEQLLVLGGGIALLLVDEKKDYFLEVIVDLSIATIVLQVLVALPGGVVVGLAFPSNLTRSARINRWCASYPVAEVLFVELIVGVAVVVQDLMRKDLANERRVVFWGIGPVIGSEAILLFELVVGGFVVVRNADSLPGRESLMSGGRGHEAFGHLLQVAPVLFGVLAALVCEEFLIGIRFREGQGSVRLGHG
jgi:hypothetical protein